MRKSLWLSLGFIFVVCGCASQSEQASNIKIVEVADPMLSHCQRVQDVSTERNAWAFGMGYFSARKQVVYDLQEQGKKLGADTLVVTNQSYIPVSGITKASGTVYRCAK
ncbi:DUF4156 domain-containing protein [Kluyvera sp. STS39-E]|uniref:DUF4156 domain-containing protein n=1 Tax=Kluyvera sp. STS39-E TaxID=3234748 RepID=UPI0034C64350